jgi:hypothetical protein
MMGGCQAWLAGDVFSKQLGRFWLGVRHLTGCIVCMAPWAAFAIWFFDLLVLYVQLAGNCRELSKSPCPSLLNPFAIL